MLTILALTLAVHAAPEAAPPDLGELGDVLGFEDAPFALFPAAEGPNGIWQGDETNGYPNVVALANIRQNHIFCSGTLIQDRWVVTAAHCLEDIDWDFNRGDLYILFGNDIRNDGYIDAIEWANYIGHPSYDAENFRNDIGLVQLSSAKVGVDFAVVNNEGLTIDWYDQLLTFVGFGITYDDANDSGTKRETDIPIDNYDVQYVYSEDRLSNVCSGDSGGAAFETLEDGSLELVGVNAFVYGNNGPDGPVCADGGNGATRIDMHIDFITGYVPDILLGVDDPGGGGNGNGNGDNAFDGEVDLDSYDRDLGDVATPTSAKYPKRLRCATGPVPGSVGWMAVLGLLGVLSRRRG